ncbi:MAG TPA: ferredoxin [Solirubrobacteraceae bacterium]
MTRCQGYANCVMAAPEVFDIDETTGVAVLLDARPGADRRAAVEEAVRNCPTEAISVKE